MKLYAGETGRRMREKLLAEQKLTAIEPEEFKSMEALVKRMAKRLATKYSRKRHRADRGKLDVRKTIRKSMGHGGVPFDIVWKTKTIDKPKIVVICDVSRSVAAAAQFLLLFLYSLNEVVEKLDAFAFSDRMVHGRRHAGRRGAELGHRPHPQADRLSADRLRPGAGRLLRKTTATTSIVTPRSSSWATGAPTTSTRGST